MMRRLVTFLALSCATPALACNPDLIGRLDLPVRDDGDVRLDVAEILSTEGGEWKVWLGPNGEAEEIVRIDYGEMGRVETRLLIGSAEAYALTHTLYSYAAPIYAEGARTVRIETDIYAFCAGELLVPPEDFGINADYAKAAAKVAATFRAEEIADYVPASF